MSAFQAYGGSYEFNGGAYAWRCYATSRVYEIRRLDHAPFPKAPLGRKWVTPTRQDHEQKVGCLVDEAVEHFSQILLQVQPAASGVIRTREREAAEAVAV